jgi:hypothetical protein
VSGKIPKDKRDTSFAREALQARAFLRKKSEVQVAKEVKKIQLQQAATVARMMILPAVGMTFVYKKEAGRSTRVEDPDEICTALNAIDNNGGFVGEGLYYYITTKEPDYRAGEAILNRAIGKVPDKVEQKIDVQFSLRGLARLRGTLPELAPMPVDARVIDMPND